jgi:hypothetical protein
VYGRHIIFWRIVGLKKHRHRSQEFKQRQAVHLTGRDIQDLARLHFALAFNRRFHITIILGLLHRVHLASSVSSNHEKEPTASGDHALESPGKFADNVVKTSAVHQLIPLELINKEWRKPVLLGHLSQGWFRRHLSNHVICCFQSMMQLSGV